MHMNAFTKVAATAVVVPLGLLAMTLPSHAETATATEECVASPPVPGTPAQYLYSRVITEAQSAVIEYDVENKQRTNWQEKAPEGEGWKITDTRVKVPEESHQEYVVEKKQRTNWRTTPPEGSGWKITDTRVKVPEESHTEYDISFSDETDWVRTSPGAGWVQSDERSYEVTPAVPGTDAVMGTEYKFSFSDSRTGVLLEDIPSGWDVDDEHKITDQEEVLEYKFFKNEFQHGLLEVPEGWTVKSQKKVVTVEQVLEHKFFKNEELYGVLTEEIPAGWTIKRERVRTTAVDEVREPSGWVLEEPEGEGWELIDSRDAVDAKEAVICEVPEEETPVDEEEPATDSPKDEEPVKVVISIPTTIHVKISTLTSEKSPESAPVAKKADVAQATTSTKAAPAKDAALAHTGGPSGLIAGLGLLLAGAGAVIASRRK